MGLGNFLELFLSLLIAGIFVGMVFNREFAVGFFNLVIRGGFGHAQDFVVISFDHNSCFIILFWHLKSKSARGIMIVNIKRSF